ncbi:hypothetical protein B566_EDAN003153 [Ephemera danica]|nr:hypothetical protein B566_EDAN003153 [Ephemera danica]
MMLAVGAVAIHLSSNVNAGLLKVRWEHTEVRAVGSPLGPQPLSRRNSTPPRSIAPAAEPTSPTSSVPISSNGHRRLDRCHSEPAERSLALLASKQQQQQQQQQVNTSRYKTELCRPYEESGTCKYGDKCQFAHGAHELRCLARHPKYKTELCRTFHTSGFCPYGPRCHFVHNAEEARLRGITLPPAAAAALAAAAAAPGRPRPLNLGGSAFSLGGSTGESPSPPCSLSESPTSSLGSFFSEPDLLQHYPVTPRTTTSTFGFGPDFAAPLLALANSRTELHLAPLQEIEVIPAQRAPSPVSPPGSPLERLPVFNRLSSLLA